MTAEFALTLPLVVAVLALVLGGLTLATQRIAAVALAAELARAEARGDTAAASQQLARVPRGARVARGGDSELHCVTVTIGLASGPLRALAVSGHSCAARSAPLAP